jgi:aspartate-semialdehyde dehydrogenase
MSYKVAIVGATGNVGREMMNVLVERGFPISELYAVASPRSAGREISFGDDQVLKVQGLDKFNFKGVDIVLASAGSKISKEFAPGATKAGAVIIDNSSLFRMDHDVPLVVPEVNPAGDRRKIQGPRHHRQPELLDHPDGRGAEADA